MAKFTDLPEPIIHDVISLLNFRDAAMVSIVSKELLTACRTRPDLEFNFKDHLHPEQDEETEKRQNFFQPLMKLLRLAVTKRKIRRRKSKRRALVDCIDQTMGRYRREKIPIQSFTCRSFGFEQGIALGILEEWIQIAAENGAQTLDLFSGCNLPGTVLRSESLVELNLDRICLNLGEEPIQEIRCPRLKRLSLKDLEIDKAMFENLKSGLNSIEDLEIRNCCGLKNLVITKLPCLKRLEIRIGSDECVDVEVQSGSLEVLKFFGSNDKCDLILHPCLNLKYLSLVGAEYIANTFFEDLDNKFPHLKDLILSINWVSPAIKISSSSLERLDLRFTSTEMRVHAPRINQFYYFKVDRSRMFPVYFTGASKDWFSEITLEESLKMDTFWFGKLKGVIANINQSRISLNLLCRGFRNVEFDANEVTDDHDNGPPSIERLSLAIVGGVESLRNMLDGAFWCCRPKTLALLWAGREGIEKEAWVLDRMMMNRSEHQEQEHSNMKFWQQDLKLVKSEAVDGLNLSIHAVVKLYRLEWQTSPQSSE